MFRTTMAVLCVAAQLIPTARADDSPAAIREAELGTYARALAIYRADTRSSDSRAREMVGLMLWFGDPAPHGPLTRDGGAATQWLARTTAHGGKPAHFALATQDTRDARATEQAKAQQGYGCGELLEYLDDR